MQLTKAALLVTLSSANSLRKISQYEMPTLLTQPALQDEANLLDVQIEAYRNGDFFF